MKCLFQIITVTIKSGSGFERYTNKKWRKILTIVIIIIFLIKKRKPKDKVSHSKSLAKIKYKSLKTTYKWKFPGLPDSAFYCDEIPSCSNPINPNYRQDFQK